VCHFFTEERQKGEYRRSENGGGLENHGEGIIQPMFLNAPEEDT
jgi:hypothetical protein